MAHQLAQIMLELGLVSQEQLQQAHQLKLAAGVRLGTALVQLGFVSIDALSDCLSRRFGLPEVRPSLLDDTPQVALNSVTRDLVIRHRVLPFLRDANRLHVAMLDPDKDFADRLGRSLNLVIKRYVCPELRLHYQIEKHYRIPRDARFLRNAPHLQPGASLAAAVAQVSPEKRRYVKPTIEIDVEIDDVPAEFTGVDVDLDDLDEPAVNDMAEEFGLVFLDQYEFTAPSKPETPAPTPVTTLTGLSKAEQTVVQLRAAESEESVFELFSEPVVAKATSGVLLFLRGNLAIGVAGFGPSMDLPKIRQLSVQLEQRSVLRLVLKRKQLARVSTGRDPLLARLAGYLGTPRALGVCVAPIVAGDNVLQLACLFSGEDAPFDESTMAEVRDVLAAMIEVYGSRGWSGGGSGVF